MTVVALLSPRSQGKTTIAAFAAAAAKQLGIRTAGVDADESRHWASWHDAWDDGLPESLKYPLLAASTTGEVRNTIDMLSANADLVIVDVGHLENHRDLGFAAAMKSDVLLSVTSPTMQDLERMQELPMITQEAKDGAERRSGFLTEVAEVRPDAVSRCVLTRVNLGSPATNDQYASMISGMGIELLKTRIPDRKVYRDTGLTVPPRPAAAAAEEPGQLVREVMGLR